MPDDSTAFIIQSINSLHERIAGFRLEMVQNLNDAAREQRESLARLTEKVDGFMLEQARLNPTLATQTRVDAIDARLTVIDTTVNERAIRQEHIEQDLKEQSERTVARKHLWEGAAAVTVFNLVSTFSLVRLPDILTTLSHALAKPG